MELRALGSCDRAEHADAPEPSECEVRPSSGVCFEGEARREKRYERGGDRGADEQAHLRLQPSGTENLFDKAGPSPRDRNHDSLEDALPVDAAENGSCFGALQVVP